MAKSGQVSKLPLVAAHGCVYEYMPLVQLNSLSLIQFLLWYSFTLADVGPISLIDTVVLLSLVQFLSLIQSYYGCH